MNAGELIAWLQANAEPEAPVAVVDSYDEGEGYCWSGKLGQQEELDEHSLIVTEYETYDFEPTYDRRGNVLGSRLKGKITVRGVVIGHRA